MGRQKARKKHQYRFDREHVFQLIALGFDKKRILKEAKISERSYYNVKAEYDALPDAEKQVLRTKAESTYDERIYDHDYWFRWDAKTQRGESHIPLIQEWYETMLLRDLKPRQIQSKIRKMRDICYGLMTTGKVGRGVKQRIRPNRIPPQNFTEDDGVEWILLLKKLGLGDYNDRMAIRHFLQFGKGIVPKKISGKKSGYGTMAREYFRDDEREAVFHVLTHGEETLKDVIAPLAEKYGWTIKDMADAVYTATFFMFHSMTRIDATCKVMGKYTEGHGFETINVNGSDVMQVTLKDKGRKGKDVFTKPLVAPLRRQIESYGIRNGRMFPFDDGELRKVLKVAYERAGITRRIKQPGHIWRHTGAMYWLRKTGWNYAFVCIIGGWEGDQTLKDCYGKPETVDVLKMLASAQA